MELTDIALPAVVGTMALNHLVMRVMALRGSAAAFWSLQLLNLAVGSGLILLGLPGFETVPIVAWLLALMFFFRVVLNNNERQAWLIEQREAADAKEDRAVKQAFLDALRKGEAEGDPAE